MQDSKLPCIFAGNDFEGKSAVFLTWKIIFSLVPSTDFVNSHCNFLCFCCLSVGLVRHVGITCTVSCSRDQDLPILKEILNHRSSFTLIEDYNFDDLPDLSK